MKKKELAIHNVDDFKGKIYTIRGVQVMLDSDLAEIYGYEVKTLNQQVKRNINRFPPDFMFQLTREELDLVKSQYENLDEGVSKLICPLFVFKRSRKKQESPNFHKLGLCYFRKKIVSF